MGKDKIEQMAKVEVGYSFISKWNSWTNGEAPFR